MSGSKAFKRSLVFVMTMYLAFATFFSGNSPFERTLQEEEENSTALAPIEKDGDKDPVDILVIVMGEAQAMPRWKALMGSMDAKIELLYGAFDEDLSADACENEDGLDCQFAYIPGTTWTSGRNLLAEEALRRERKREKKYDYWLFMDDDVNVVCVGGQPMEDLLRPGHCWQKVFNFISSDHVPENASTLALGGGKGVWGFSGFSTTDAFFAAFKRDRIDHIFPYPTLQEGYSEWISQAALFCIMRTCHKSSAVVIPYVVGRNNAHREYTRGLNMGEIYGTIKDNYHDEETEFYPCEQLTSHDIFQGLDNTGLFESGEELNKNIPPPDLETCSSLNKRYDAWESQVVY